MGQNMMGQDINQALKALSSMQNDSLKMNLLDDIGLRFGRKKTDSGIYYFEKILLYGKHHKDPPILAKSYLELGINYLSK